jgi:hypothetical protein
MDPIPDPLLLRNVVEKGIEPWTSRSVSSCPGMCIYVPKTTWQTTQIEVYCQPQECIGLSGMH